jgi:radical SAM protein with 4Fe4S-binding SPASM domain
MIDPQCLQPTNERDAKYIEGLVQNRELAAERTAKPEFKVPRDHVLAFSWNTFLRKDSTQIVYYGREFLATWSGRIAPSQAVLLACCDGKRSIAEIARLLADHNGESLEMAEFKVRALLCFCQALSRNYFVDLTEHPEAPYRVYDPGEFAQLDRPLAYTPLYERPVSMMWMPTWVCQTDCVYCYAARKKVDGKDLLSDERVHELLEEAHELGIISMNVDGGDALCRQNITEIFAHATQLDIELAVSTKAHVTKESARELYRSGLRRLQVSFDAPFPKLFDEMVGRPGHFQRTLETIHNCVEAGIKVRTNSILTSKSYRYIHELVDFLLALPLFNIKIAPAFRSFYRGTPDLLLTEPQKQWLREQMPILIEKYPDGRINWECKSDYLAASPEKRQEVFRDFPRCGVGSECIIITPNGDVVMCEQCPQEEQFIVGNVKHRSIMDVWTSPAFRQFKQVTQEQFRGTVCGDCEDFASCYLEKGGCFIETLKAYGSRYHPHPACPKAPAYATPLQ